MGTSSNLKYIITLVALGGLMVYWAWEPSASGIAEDLSVAPDGVITYGEHTFSTEWGEPQKIEGYLRVKERHYDDNMPIITWDFLVTTGEYSDPEIVDITSYGDGNFRWQAPRQPTGSLVGYHLIPATPAAEAALQALDEGDEVVLEGKFSKTSRITTNTGFYVQLTHSNHKFVLLDAATLGAPPAG